MGLRLRLIVASAMLLASASKAATADVIDLGVFQPPALATSRPDVTHGWSIDNNVRRTGVRPFAQMVPTYDGRGKLFASWTPRSAEPGRHPTLVIVHGGHGVSPGNFATAQWAMRELDANVLILDSYWSRGRTENWLTWTEFGANMRTLDAIAAARWVRSQGADPAKTYLFGDSQGGWTTLRVFTPHDHAEEVRQLFAGGVAIYPNCYVHESAFSRAPTGSTRKEFAPPLGPYMAPVIVFTGSLDTATPISQCNVAASLKTAHRWWHFDGATHAWDAPNRGAGLPAVDGECSKAANVYNHFAVCRSDRYTKIMQEEITRFLQAGLAAAPQARVPASDLPTSSSAEGAHEARTRELLDELARPGGR